MWTFLTPWALAHHSCKFSHNTSSLLHIFRKNKTSLRLRRGAARYVCSTDRWGVEMWYLLSGVIIKLPPLFFRTLPGSISLYRLPSTCPHSSPPIMEEQAPSYIIENGIPPGSILVNPHTGNWHKRRLTHTHAHIHTCHTHRYYFKEDKHIFIPNLWPLRAAFPQPWWNPGCVQPSRESTANQEPNSAAGLPPSAAAAAGSTHTHTNMHTRTARCALHARYGLADTQAHATVCAFISVSICVSLSGASVLVCLLHSSADVTCHPPTAILYSMYRSAAPPLLCVWSIVRIDLLSFDLQIEELSSQFAHVSCQSVGEAPPLYPSSQGYIYAAPPLHPPPPPPNPANYCQPSPQVRIHQRFISQVSS